MNKYSISLAIKEMQNKMIRRYYFHVRNWQLKKTAEWNWGDSEWNLQPDVPSLPTEAPDWLLSLPPQGLNLSFCISGFSTPLNALVFQCLSVSRVVLRRRGQSADEKEVWNNYVIFLEMFFYSEYLTPTAGQITFWFSLPNLIDTQ